MTKLYFDISVSLDGYVAGPDMDPEHGLGIGGEQLHEWVVATDAWRGAHGREGGETNRDSEVVSEIIGLPGAHIMGRNMFGGGTGPWDQSWNDGEWNGWWGDDPPFHVPVFVVTHHEREPLTLSDTTYTFVTDGIESALEQARAAAGDKPVQISGGADVINQYLQAGHVDEFQLHVVPIVLGSGARLLDGLDPAGPAYEIDRVVASPAVTHVRYRVAR